MNGSSTVTPVIDRQVYGLGAIPCSVSVEEGYARWAATYDHTPNPLLALEQRCLLPLLPNISGKRVLDLACGTGRWLEKLLAAGSVRGVGIDLSWPMLGVARKKTAIGGRLARADCRKLPFRKAAFDLAVCSFALAHIRNLSELATECSRVLQQSAHLYITELHPTAYAAGWRAGFRDHQGALQIETAPHALSEIVNVFGGTGFKLSCALDCFVGESERPLFTSAGKERLFDAARLVPAVSILHFRSGSLASEK